MSANAWLGHLTVLDAGTGPAAKYAGWMFGQNGARVLDAGMPASSQLTAAATDFLDSGKQRVDVLPDHVDVLLVDDATPRDGLSTARLTGVVTGYNPRGPRAGWAADELVVASMGGAAAYTVGREGQPVYGFGYRYQYLAGLYLYCGLVADASAADGRPHEVSVSLLETVASLLPYATTQYVYNGSRSLLEQSGPRFVVGCSDGWVVVYAGLAWRALVGMLDRPDLATDPRFVELGHRFRHVRELGALFDAWGAGHTVAEALAAGERHDVATSVVRSPAEVLADEDLRARATWHPTRGGGLAPAIPNLLVSEGVA